jgi:hypothetical protein
MMTIDLENEPNYSWYESVNADTRLSQGDIILDCPIVQWAAKPVELNLDQECETLVSLTEVAKADLIVMTQACDLEQNKVANVILCPHLPLEKYREHWEKAVFAKEGKPANTKQWKRICSDLKNGYTWNLSMLNEGSVNDLILTHRIVDFHEVYTLPRVFLESLLQGRAQPRLRLRPPYREHLSQAFARYFMRVGLPTGIKDAW